MNDRRQELGEATVYERQVEATSNEAISLGTHNGLETPAGTLIQCSAKSLELTLNRDAYARSVRIAMRSANT